MARDLPSIVSLIWEDRVELCDLSLRHANGGKPCPLLPPVNQGRVVQMGLLTSTVSPMSCFHPPVIKCGGANSLKRVPSPFLSHTHTHNAITSTLSWREPPLYGWSEREIHRRTPSTWSCWSLLLTPRSQKKRRERRSLPTFVWCHFSNPSSGTSAKKFQCTQNGRFPFGVPQVILARPPLPLPRPHPASLTMKRSAAPRLPHTTPSFGGRPI